MDLPEFIDNLISNLKGGISIERALIKSVRKTQKHLFKEITLINQKVLMGGTVIDALSEFKDRFHSPVIDHTMTLIEQGLKGGGDVVSPLEKISNNLKKIYNLNDEIKSNSAGFALVIKLITLAVAPLLFALAITLLNFISDLFGLLSSSGNEMLDVAAVPPEFHTYLIIFSYSMITLIVVFSSLISSELSNEDVYQSLKYMPIFLTISIVIFNVSLNLLLGFFGGILA
jgi:archaellum biogenesis protein FlaJ (TadC family)